MIEIATSRLSVTFVYIYYVVVVFIDGRPTNLNALKKFAKKVLLDKRFR